MSKLLQKAKARLVKAQLGLTYPLAIVGVDPGGTTGVAIYTIEAPELPATQRTTIQWAESDQVPYKLKKQIQFLAEIGYDVVLVIEQFDKRPGVVDPDFTPLFIINDIERMLYDVNKTYQTPSQAKNLVKPPKSGTPDGLKRFGWYQVGMGHANDASRHVITFLVETLKHQPTILRGWPRRGDS